MSVTARPLDLSRLVDSTRARGTCENVPLMKTSVTPIFSHNPTPRLSATDAEAVVKRHFGLDAEASALPSERDQNFRVVTDSGENFVLKISNSDEQRAVLELQNAVFAHLARVTSELAVPRVVKSVSAESIVTVGGKQGHTHMARLVSWLDGTLFVNARPHDARLLASLGTSLALLDQALQGFVHPAMFRKLHWDLRHAAEAFEHRKLMTEREQALLHDFAQSWQNISWQQLRHGVIHGDANNYNVLVRDGRVVGLLDFGDMVHSAVVGDLAIAAAYAMLDKPDPIGAAVVIVRAYHAGFPLTVAEARALYPLITARLCMSVCYAALNARAKSEDSYQQVTAAPAWALLERLAALPSAVVTDTFQQACSDS